MIGRFTFITLLTDDVQRMADFYRDVLEIPVARDLGDYVEFANPGVTFAICDRAVLWAATESDAYAEPPRGQVLALAFLAEDPARVDAIYAFIVQKGALPIQPPADMSWGQRVAFFADLDGNIHELYADLA